jgi:hypothetical protein
MKVSRKVGRRSHSSISRRRLRNKKTKSGYRKKHTQQGGRRGRGYKRARTHKRGKRFHRGGENGFDNCNNISLFPLYRNRDGSPIPQSDDINTQRRYFTTNTPTIYYTKVGSRFAMEDDSEFTIYVDFITSGDHVDLVIDFTRDTFDDKSPTFLFQIQGSKKKIKEFLDNMPSLLTDTPQTESYEKYSQSVEGNGILKTKIPPDSPRRVYSFKSSKNLATFKKIADCIKSKILRVADAVIPYSLRSAADAAAKGPVAAADPAASKAAAYHDNEYSTTGFSFS